MNLQLPPNLPADRWKHLALIPSLYGVVPFVVAFLLYELRLLPYEPLGAQTLLLCLFATSAFALSACLHAGPYRRVGDQLAARMSLPGRHDPLLLDGAIHATLYAVGFLGLALYVRALVDLFGSPLGFLVALTQSSHEVRRATDSIQTIGVQLTYVGWIAIALTAASAARGTMRWYWVMLALLQFAGNLVFVDRTRPMWILVTCALVAMAARFERLRAAQLLRAFALIAILLIALFVVVGFWVGKVSTSDPQLFGITSLPPVAQSVYYYITGSFAYFNRIVDVNSTIAWIPERSLYPLFKALAAIGAVDQPPSQVNDIYFVPFPTNTGTILEPLYRDGGPIFATIGLAALVFAIDTVALAFLRNGSFLALLAWAHLCFANLLAFFTPKFNNTPIWLAVSLGLAAVILWPNRGARPPRAGSLRAMRVP